MFERNEIIQLKQRGFHFNYPHEIVTSFENEIAKYCGAPYGVAVDCATHAIELCLRYLKAQGKISIPAQTYPSIPMMALQLGLEIDWSQDQWLGDYQLSPYPVIDSSVRFLPDIYTPKHFVCLSFQFKKRLPIGRGGMILTDNQEAAHWLRKASYDGRNPGIPWKEDSIDMVGWHYYMTPEDAARGLLLLDDIKKEDILTQALTGAYDYPDLSQWPIFQKN